MPTALVVTADLGGNLPPVLGVGRELVARGWRVVVLADHAATAAAAAEGLQTVESQVAPFDARRPRTTRQALVDYPALIADRRRGREAVATARGLVADVAIVDPMLIGALAELEAAGVPTVVVAHSTWEGVRTFVGGPMGFFARRRGTAPFPVLAAASRVVVASDARLGRPLTLPANARITGPVLQEVPKAAAHGPRPLVLVSLSTVAFPGQREALQRILDAVATLPVDVRASAGGTAVTGLRAGSNTTLEPRIDHATLMPRASAIVGHGGHATVVRALAHGLPMVLLPMHPMIDQPRIAKAVAATGAAIALKKSAPADRVAEAVRRVLEEPSFGEVARRMGADLVAADGAGRAADEVEAVAAVRV